MKVLLVLTFSMLVCPTVSQVFGLSNMPSPLLNIFANIGTSSNPNCPAVCTTQWMILLQAFRMNVGLKPNDSLCRYATNQSLFTECQPNVADPNLPCRIYQPELGSAVESFNFHCCPRNCVEPILSCVGDTIPHICIPSKLTPWRSRIMAIYVKHQTEMAKRRSSPV